MYWDTGASYNDLKKGSGSFFYLACKDYKLVAENEPDPF